MNKRTQIFGSFFNFKRRKKKLMARQKNKYALFLNDSKFRHSKKIKVYYAKNMWGLGTPEDLTHFLENYK